MSDDLGQSGGRVTGCLTTWREAIERAHAAVEAAEVERARVLREAHDAGLSLRDIAVALPVNHTTVARWIGEDGKGKPGASLDDPCHDALRAAGRLTTSPDRSSLRRAG